VATSHRIYPYVRGRRFFNTKHEKPEGFFFRSMWMYIRSVLKRYSLHELQHWHQHYDDAQHAEHSKTPYIVWIGHATFLIRIAGMTIITDPIFGNLSRGLFQRLLKPACHVHEMPDVDVILISHNHYDHMDERSIKAIASRNPHVRICVPEGDKRWFTQRGYTNVVEHMWWDAIDIPIKNDTIRFTFLPAYHWSQRGVFDRNTSLWGSWLLSTPSQNIYFGGDTAYHKPYFSAIADEFPLIDIALLPIAPCEPRKWQRSTHMDADDAGQAFLDLGARSFVPMHWGAYQFGLDDPLLPIVRLKAWWEKNNAVLQDKKLILPRCGEKVSLEARQTPRQYHNPYQQTYNQYES
jgi:L-ascorbate metabolism protein UlaG (beta-lactamase superfamily)